MDVVVLNSNGPARLFINQVGDGRHWLGIHVRDADGTRDVPHARVELTPLADDVSSPDEHDPHDAPEHAARWRHVHTDGSYLSSSDPRVTFGLGDAHGPRSVRVRWPDGQVEQWSGLAVDRYWTLQRGTGESVD